MDSEFVLRPYQRQAVDALFQYFRENDGNPLIALPTGSGKSIVQAAFVQEALAQWPDERFLLLSHVKELLEQNASKIPGAGIYSAGLNRRELGHQVTVAGIQSIYKRADEVGDIGLVIIDECHLCTRVDHGMYQRFLADLRQHCPHVKVVGMSATPFRLDSGPLIKGDNRIFTAIVADINIKDLIKQGYLAPLTTAKTKHKADVRHVKKRGGDYITGDLEQAMLGSTSAALDEVELMAADRKGWLVFCVGVAHAKQVRDALIDRQINAAIVIGQTPKDLRNERIQAFKDGRLRALVSVGVLTTGFDAPSADCLICLRPTLSPGLWVQMVGRLSRTAEGKTDGLVLDFTGNTYEHGPIDCIDVDGDGNIHTAPYRVCPMCGELNDPRNKECDSCKEVFKKGCPKCMSLVDKDSPCCHDCGHWFEGGREPKHSDKASDGDIISSDAPIGIDVDGWRFARHRKEGKPDSLRVTYDCGLTSYTEWVCLEHGGFATTKAIKWWRTKSAFDPPSTITDAIKRSGELKMPERIHVKRDGKYWRVIA